VTTNPTLRPFVLGALLFLSMLVGWPSESKSAGRAKCEIFVNNRSPYRVLIHVDGVYYGWVNVQQSFTFKGIPSSRPVVYGTTQYSEYFWGPKALKCQDRARWDLTY
jgi:hypothetical protein